MKLNDDKNTIINVVNVCWARPGESQGAGRGAGMEVRFTGGNSHLSLEYKDPKALDDDLRRIQEGILHLENPRYYLSRSEAIGPQ